MASLTLARPSTAGMAASRSAFTGAGALRLAAPRPSSMRATRSLTAPLVLNKVKREKVTARPVKGEKREEAVDPRAPKFNKLSSGRKCQLTGQKANNAMVVTFSHKRNKKLQQVNLQKKKVYWPEAQRLVHLKISTKTMKTLEKKGLATMAEEAGINLWKLPYTDVSDVRKKYVAANTGVVPVAKNPRRMKNPEKLAASKKAPMQARYVLGRIEWYRPAK